MGKRNRYSPEVRERAVRMVFDHEGEYESQWKAIRSIADKIGCSAETLVGRKVELVGAVAAATSLEEFDTILSTFNFDEACLPIAQEVGLLGIDLQLPCG